MTNHFELSSLSLSHPTQFGVLVTHCHFGQTAFAGTDSVGSLLVSPFWLCNMYEVKQEQRNLLRWEVLAVDVVRVHVVVGNTSRAVFPSFVFVT